MDNDKDHFFMTVEVGDGAVHFITNPNAEPNLQWMLRYGGRFGNDLQTAVIASATVLSGFDYLLSGNINLKEATRRLGLMRKARQAAIAQPKG